MLFLVAFAAIGALAGTAYMKWRVARSAEMRTCERQVCLIALAALVLYPVVRFLFLKGNQGLLADFFTTLMCAAVLTFYLLDKLFPRKVKKVPHAAE